MLLLFLFAVVVSAQQPCTELDGRFLTVAACHQQNGIYFWDIPEPKCYCSDLGPVVGLTDTVCNATLDPYSVIRNVHGQNYSDGNVVNRTYNAAGDVVTVTVPLRTTTAYSIALWHGQFFSSIIGSGSCTITLNVVQPTAQIVVSGYKDVKAFDDQSPPFTYCGIHYANGKLGPVKGGQCMVWIIFPNYDTWGLFSTSKSNTLDGPFTGIIVQNE